MQAKPVQIAIIVIGLLVGVVGIVLALRGDKKPDLANKIVLVDVTTGDAYAVSIKGRSIVLPYKHPETEQRTLLPMNVKQGDGWYLDDRYLSALDRIENVSTLVDPKSGKVAIDINVKPTVLK